MKTVNLQYKPAKNIFFTMEFIIIYHAYHQFYLCLNSASFGTLFLFLLHCEIFCAILRLLAKKNYDSPIFLSFFSFLLENLGICHRSLFWNQNLFKLIKTRPYSFFSVSTWLTVRLFYRAYASMLLLFGTVLFEPHFRKFLLWRFMLRKDSLNPSR